MEEATCSSKSAAVVTCNSKVWEEVITCDDDDDDAYGIPCMAFREQRLMI